jgi:nitrogen fixation NifU-like protein
MSDLRELYQEVILDHSRHPRHFQVLEHADRSADGYNPLCGDKITVFLRTKDGRIEEAAFQGSGCAISMASASLMTQAIRGATTEELKQTFRAFRDMVTGQAHDDTSDSALLGKLIVFAGVSKFPVRVKCATLAWHTARAAMEHRPEPVSTE